MTETLIMTKMMKLLSYALLATLLISGCHSKTETHHEDLFKYKDAFVGDNSAVIPIINQVMSSEKFNGLELQTKQQPYGIILNYDGLASEDSYKKAVIYNATYLFTLIQNVEWVTFKFNNQDYKIQKRDLVKWYGEDFSQSQSEKE